MTTKLSLAARQFCNAAEAGLIALASHKDRLELDLLQRPELIEEILEIGGVVGKAGAKIIGEIRGHELAGGRRAGESYQSRGGIDAVTRGTLPHAVEIDRRDGVRRGDRLGEAAARQGGAHRAHQ